MLNYQDFRDHKIETGDKIFRRLTNQDKSDEAERLRTLAWGCRQWTLDITSSDPDIYRFIGWDRDPTWSGNSLRSFTVRLDEASLRSPRTYGLIAEAMARG